MRLDRKEAGDDSERNSLLGDAAEGMEVDGGGAWAGDAGAEELNSELREAWPDDEPGAVRGGTIEAARKSLRSHARRARVAQQNACAP